MRRQVLTAAALLVAFAAHALEPFAPYDKFSDKPLDPSTEVVHLGRDRHRYVNGGAVWQGTYPQARTVGSTATGTWLCRVAGTRAVMKAPRTATPAKVRKSTIL